MSMYGSMITSVGEEALLAASTSGAGIALTHMLIGDGNGDFVTPESLIGRETLHRQVHRTPITNMYDDPEQPNQKIVEAMIPVDVGGFTIRELALEDSTGRMIAAGNFPATPKTTLAEGCTRDLLLRFVVATSHVAQLVVVVDHSVLMATAQDLEDHRLDADPHRQYVSHAEHPGLHPWRYFFGQL